MIFAYIFYICILVYISKSLQLKLIVNAFKLIVLKLKNFKFKRIKNEMFINKF